MVVEPNPHPGWPLPGIEAWLWCRHSNKHQAAKAIPQEFWKEIGLCFLIPLTF